MNVLNFFGSQSQEGVTLAPRPNTVSAPMCSGYGQWHSPKNKKCPKQYTTVTYNHIVEMAKNTPSTPKTDAQWVVPSTMLTREHAEQRANGDFQMLWADIDENPVPIADLCSIVDKIFPGNESLVYNSKSAKEGIPKARILIPLESSTAGYDYVIMQKIFNDCLQRSGLTPDRVNERPGQLCYLPNRGDVYTSRHAAGSGFNRNTWTAYAKEEMDRLRQQAKEAADALKVAMRKTQERMQTTGKSALDAYKETYPVELALEQYGYMKKAGRWLSPNSGTGSPGVTVKGNRWISSHGSDSEIGLPFQGGSSGDAFDLFCFYECGNDQARAVKKANDLLGMKYEKPVPKDNGITFTMDSMAGYNPKVPAIKDKNEGWPVKEDEKKEDDGWSNYEAPKVEEKKKFEWVNVRDIELRPPDWIVHKLIEKDTLGILFAQPGCGKSFFAIDLSCCISEGKDFHGYKVVAPGTVFYLVGEGQNGLKRRFEAWEIQNNTKVQNIPISKTAAALSDEEFTDGVIESIQAYTESCGVPALIVIDTLARNFGDGDENTTKDMTAFVARVDKMRTELKTAILIVHHSGHGDQGRARGSIVLTGAADYEFMMVKDDQNVINVESVKDKEGDGKHGMMFKLQTVPLPMKDAVDGKQVTSAVLKRQDVCMLDEICEKLCGQVNQRINMDHHVTENKLKKDDGYKGVWDELKMLYPNTLINRAESMGRMIAYSKKKGYLKSVPEPIERGRNLIVLVVDLLEWEDLKSRIRAKKERQEGKVK